MNDCQPVSYRLINFPAHHTRAPPPATAFRKRRKHLSMPRPLESSSTQSPSIT